MNRHLLSAPALRRLVFGLAWLLLAPALVAAAPEPAAEGSGGRGRAEVVVLNRPIVVLRAPLGGYTADQRARSVETRIQGFIESGRTGEVTVDAMQLGNAVQVGGMTAFVITPQDLDTIAGETLEAVTEGAVQRLTLVLREGGETRSVRALLTGAAFAGLATVLFALFLLIAARISRWTHARLGGIADRQLARLDAVGFSALSRSVARALHLVLGLVRFVATAVVTYAWLTYCLSRIPYTRAWGESLSGFIFKVLHTVALGLLQWVPGLVFVGVIFTATHYLNRLIRSFFDAAAAGTIRLPEAFAETAAPTRRLVSMGLWLFALVMAYPYLPGSGTEAFKGVSVFVGLMISLGGTGVVGLATSGMVLMYSRALRPGDYVRVGDHEGTVISLGTFSTRLRTPWLEEVSIPNQVLVGTTVINYSRAAHEAGVFLRTTVTIGYDTPWRQVHALLLLAAERTPGLRREPAPHVVQSRLDDFYVAYTLSAHLERPEQRVPVLGALHAQIQDAFNEHGVQIMSPHYLSDPAKPKIVPKEHWNEPPARGTP